MEPRSLPLAVLTRSHWPKNYFWLGLVIEPRPVFAVF
jgi:hypothetical protein